MCTLQHSIHLVLLQGAEPHLVPEVSRARSEGGEGGWVHGQYIQTGKQPADTLGSREGRDDATLLSPWLLAYNYRGLPLQVIKAISDRGLSNRAKVIHNL